MDQPSASRLTANASKRLDGNASEGAFLTIFLNTFLTLRPQDGIINLNI
jgi:hypothetical protein